MLSIHHMLFCSFQSSVSGGVCKKSDSPNMLASCVESQAQQLHPLSSDRLGVGAIVARRKNFGYESALVRSHP
jgi:hypothetical protein